MRAVSRPGYMDPHGGRLGTLHARPLKAKSLILSTAPRACGWCDQHKASPQARRLAAKRAPLIPPRSSASCPPPRRIRTMGACWPLRTSQPCSWSETRREVSAHPPPPQTRWAGAPRRPPPRRRPPRTPSHSCHTRSEQGCPSPHRGFLARCGRPRTGTPPRSPPARRLGTVCAPNPARHQSCPWRGPAAAHAARRALPASAR
mmetsp:Transcript_30668/g.76748  ORF Transcript_30668/g.76748 Transcript_30668/m.76748 type:complete len:203 (-) Transcript_30668:62-670(-)